MLGFDDREAWPVVPGTEEEGEGEGVRLWVHVPPKFFIKSQEETSLPLALQE